MINDLQILIERLLQHVDEMSRAKQPPIASTRLDSNPVHDDDDDTNDEDNNNSILK